MVKTDAIDKIYKAFNRFLLKAENRDTKKLEIEGKKFSIHEIGKIQDKSPGVYLFMKPEGNTGWNILYVGETGNFKRRLSTRLKQHHRYNDLVTRGKATHIAIRKVPGDEKARLDLETYLINLLILYVIDSCFLFHRYSIFSCLFIDNYGPIFTKIFFEYIH